MERYQKEMAALTVRQREAVETIDGPLMVIAGPGTGKTQLLSMRVAHILKQTDTNARNILCLTFTNKAAANMRTRLQNLVGPESLQVNVKTFHSFAAEIMGEYPDYFWNGARLTTAPDAVQTDIIDSILSRLPLDNPLASKFAGQFTSTKPVRDSLKLAKEAGLTPEKLQALIEVNLAYIDILEPELVKILDKPLSYKKLADIQDQVLHLPTQNIDASVQPLVSLSTVMQEGLAQAIADDQGTNKTKHTGEWKKRYIQNENKQKGMHRQRRANQWWLELARVYDLYRKELHTRGCYDYADMLVEVISQAEKNPAMLSDLQERYQYVMIDEFQDSNAAQMRLAHLISSHPSTEGKPNLMVVGDDDQSIYKFNGAELGNMLGFRRTYPATKLVVLEENFRSSQTILDISKHIIELAEERLVHHESDISKNLIAKNIPAETGRREHISYPSAEYQYYGVAKDVAKQFKQQETIAVLARSHSSLRKIAAELYQQGIPIHYEQQRNILEHEAVQQVIALCEITQAIIDGDESVVNQGIVTILGHPVWGIPAKTLWQLAVQNRYQGKWLESLLEHEDQSLQSFGNWLLWLSGIAHKEKLPVFFDYLLGLRESEHFQNPFRSYYLQVDPHADRYIETLSALQRLRDIVQEFAITKEPTLVDFINFITLHNQNNLIISDESVFTSNSNSVQLLTVHKAKGLEFDQVYIVDCIEKEWQPRNKSRTSPANLPLQPYGDDLDDYIRLMYVAATRARHTVIVTSYRYNGAGEEVVTSPFITNALPIKVIEQKDIPDTVAVLESSLRWPELPVNDARSVFADVLQSYSLNVTALINFLDVPMGGPQLFLERNLLRLPGARTVSLAFGTAIHSALEFAQRRINSGDFDVDIMIAHFEKELRGESILREEFERWLPHGTELLKKLFDEQLLVLPEGATPEQRLQDVDIQGAIIDGKLDHIIVDGHEMLISDFKTGKPLMSFKSQAKALQTKIWKHKTQLTFYALLASNHQLYAGKHITGQMLYIEAEDPKHISRTYTPTTEEIDRLAQLCRVVYKKISNYNLPDISNYSEDYAGIQKFEQDLIDGII